jgi:hypothetical protein
MAPKSKWGDALYTIQTGNDYAFIATVSGRDRWALEELIKAGPKGCTPITNPAPRWAAYVFNLRGLPQATARNCEEQKNCAGSAKRR